MVGYCKQSSVWSGTPVGADPVGKVGNGCMLPSNSENGSALSDRIFNCSAFELFKDSGSSVSCLWLYETVLDEVAVK